MFTGIVQGIATVAEIRRASDITTLRITFPDSTPVESLQIGASVSLDGCCLTATTIDDRSVSFDLVQETLTRTELGKLKVGDLVNFERSLKFGDEIGGHLLSGHIDCVASIKRVVTTESSREMTFAIGSSWLRFIFEKGYIALNGASLTISNVEKTRGEFSVSLIPETLRVTTFEQKRQGDGVNVEIDRNTQIIVETVERIIQERGDLR